MKWKNQVIYSVKAQIAPNVLYEARRNRYIFLPSMLVKRSLYFGGLIESLSLINCQAVNTQTELYLCLFSAQVAQARYMSSSMWTFALLRDSSDLHIYKDLYGERSKPEKKRKITVELQ